MHGILHTRLAADGGLGALPGPSSLTSVQVGLGMTNQTLSTARTLASPVLASPSMSLHPLAVSNADGMMPHSSAPGVILSPAAEPFPQKQVDRVRSSLFVEMRDLLSDNISLLQQLEMVNYQCTLPALPRPRLREVSSLATWTYCFLAYVAIRSTGPANQITLPTANISAGHVRHLMELEACTEREEVIKWPTCPTPIFLDNWRPYILTRFSHHISTGA